MTGTICLGTWDKETIALVEKEASEHGVSIEAVVLELVRRTTRSSESSVCHNLDVLGCSGSYLSGARRKGVYRRDSQFRASGSKAMAMSDILWDTNAHAEFKRGADAR